MIVDVLTESGRRYRLNFDEYLWSRFSSDGYAECTERIWALKVGTQLSFPWNSPDAWEDAEFPEVGKHMYISGRDLWYVSTPVKEIIRVDVE